MKLLAAAAREAAGDAELLAVAEAEVLAVGEALSEGDALWAKAVLAYTPPATTSAESVPPTINLRLLSKTI